MTEQTPILSVQGLCTGYRGHTVLRDISFALAPGEILCVAGESGCGKSTLLRALMGADDAAEVTAGTVILAGREPDGPAPPAASAISLPAYGDDLSESGSLL